MSVTVNTAVGGAAIGGQSGGSGTVSSVDVSGGTTGLSFSGGPVTTSGTITAAGTLAVANGGTGVTTSTGTGATVRATSPTLVTPVLGTPSSGTLTSCTGLPLTTGVTGTLGVTNGGTGQTTYTDGQLLIGNTSGNTLTKATLTAGSGITITNGNGSIQIAASSSGGITLGTPQALNTLASFTYSGLSNLKRVKMMFTAVSLAAGPTGAPLIQIGPSGGVETTGYNGICRDFTTNFNFSTGVAIDTNGGAGAVYYGQVTFDLLDSTNNIWTYTGSVSNPSSGLTLFSGQKALAGAMTQIKLSAPGTTFDGGSINISYE